MKTIIMATPMNSQKEMEKECGYCFEKLNNCVCFFVKCSECGKRIPESEAMEYRGRIWCDDHDFEEQISKREEERQRAIEITNASVSSQRKGEFINNTEKYSTHNVASDGLPIIKVNEPQILKEYEGR